MQNILTVDVGTTGLKVCVFDRNGNRIITSYREYPIICPRQGWAEQNPYQWWQAFIDCITEISANSSDILKSIGVISCTGQIATPVFIRGKEAIRCNVPIWMDRRSQTQCNAFAESFGEDELYDITGLRADSMYTLYKLLWLRESDPELYDSIDLVLQPKDFINYMLTGIAAVDPAGAAATHMYDIHKNTWSEKIMNMAGISKTIMPRIMDSSEIVGLVKEEICKFTGIPLGTLVVTGSGDTTSSALGSGVSGIDEAAVVIGTASDVLLCVDKPLIDEKKRFGCYPYLINGTYLAVAGSNSSAAVFTWFRNQFYSTEKAICEAQEINSYEFILKGAEKIPAGSDGLMFLPYLSGERSPIFDSNARGVFFGIGLSHTRDHFLRALIEGISYCVKDRIELLRALGMPVSHIVMTGGGTKSYFWRQIITDMIKETTNIATEQEATSLGAAMLGACGARWYKNVSDACRGMSAIHDGNSPNPAVYDIYDHGLVKFRGLYNSLKSSY